jgi:hypothetical protein
MDEMEQLQNTLMRWEEALLVGKSDTAPLLSELLRRMAPKKVAEIAIEARERLKLRYVPLALVYEMTKSSERHRALVASTLETTLQSPEEIVRYVAIYWRLAGQRCPLSKQSKIALAAAFNRFTEQEFANSEDHGDVKLRDVLLLVHAKPKSWEQGRIFAKIANQTFLPAKTKSGFPVAKVYRSLKDRLPTRASRVSDHTYNR